MDPVSHGLFGRVLTATVRQPGPAGVVLAAVLGSWLPDADGFLVFRGFDLYLQAHASWTHAIVSTPFQAALLAGVLKMVIKRARFTPLWLGAWAGVAGHVFCDLVNGSDIALLAPFTMRVFGWHLVSMIEPAVLGILVMAALAAWRRPSHARMTGVAALAMLAALLTIKAATQARAQVAYGAVVAVSEVTATRIAPVPGRLFSWTIFDRAGGHVRAWSVDAWTGSATLLFDREDAARSALASASRDLPVIKRFLTLDGIPFARFERDGDRTLVLWSDVRKCSRDICTESFGAVFDPSGRPSAQLIRVGTIERRWAIE